MLKFLSRTFTKPLPKVSEGRESYPLTLECETSHTVSTTWYHNGVELSGMDHRELVQEGRKQMLVFKRVLATDKGTYTCSVKDQKTSTTLKVQGKYLFDISKYLNTSIHFSVRIILIFCL